jgi:hypothetical protein
MANITMLSSLVGNAPEGDFKSKAIQFKGNNISYSFPAPPAPVAGRSPSPQHFL